MRTPPSWSRHYRRVDWKSSTAPATFRRSSFPIPSTKCCGTSSAEPTRASERFRAKACPGLDPGWTPVRMKKNKKLVLTMQDQWVACCPCFETLAALAPQHEVVCFTTLDLILRACLK